MGTNLFLIASPSPLQWGKVGMGVDVLDLPPHLNPPPPWGRKFFLAQLGLWNLLLSSLCLSIAIRKSLLGKLSYLLER